MTLSHCQTRRAVVVVSPAPLHCLTRCRVGQHAKLTVVVTPNASPTLKEAQSPPMHLSYVDWWRNGQQAMTEDPWVERIVCRNSCAES